MQTENIQPKVSICMASYNHENYVRQAIDSVLAQTYENFEFIIIENGSNDNSLNIIKGYIDSRIKLTRFEKNMHSTYAANEALKQCTGKYIAFICSDDTWHYDKLREQVDYLENNKKYGAVFTRIHVVNERDELIDSTPYHNYFNSHRNRNRYKWLNFCYDFPCNPFCCSSALVRKNVIDECGAFEILSRNMQDFILWVNILFKYDVYILPFYHTYMRYFKSNTNITGNTLQHNIIVGNESHFIYKIYEQISDIAELTKIFPELKCRYHSMDNKFIKFYLAILGIEANRVDLKAYAIRLLYIIMNNNEIRTYLEREYNFSYMTLYTISEKTDIYKQYINFMPYSLFKFCRILKKYHLYRIAKILFLPVKCILPKEE